MARTDDGWVDHLKLRLPTFWHFVVQRFKRGERYGLDFTLAFVVIVIALFVFLELVEGAVTESSLQSLDTALQSFMSQILTEGMTERVVFITDLGGTRGTTIGVVLVGIPLLLIRRWWSLFGLVFATAGGGLVVLGLKALFSRARPAEMVIEAGGYAFPSGHAFSAMVFFGYLIYLAHKHFRSAPLQALTTILAFSLIVLIGLSRVYLNVHWLTDVLGGFIAGIAWLVLSILIVRHVEWPGRRVGRRRPGHRQSVHHGHDDPARSERGGVKPGDGELAKPSEAGRGEPDRDDLDHEQSGRSEPRQPSRGEPGRSNPDHDEPSRDQPG